MSRRVPLVSSDQVNLGESVKYELLWWLRKELKCRLSWVGADLAFLVMTLDSDPIFAVYNDLSDRALVDDDNIVEGFKVGNKMEPNSVVKPIRQSSRARGCDNIWEHRLVSGKVEACTRNGGPKSLYDLFAEAFNHVLGFSVRFHTGKYTTTKMLGGAPRKVTLKGPPASCS